MIFSENRRPLFRIMLDRRHRAAPLIGTSTGFPQKPGSAPQPWPNATAGPAEPKERKL
jgi:hypothetical protein